MLSDDFFFALESCPSGMLLVRSNGSIRFANRQAGIIFGCEQAELTKLNIDDLVPDEVRSSHPSHRDRFFSNPTQRAMGAGLDLMARRRDGALLV